MLVWKIQNKRLHFQLDLKSLQRRTILRSVRNQPCWVNSCLWGLIWVLNWSIAITNCLILPNVGFKKRFSHFYLCQGGHVMLRSVCLFVCLFVTRITQSLVKDLNENIYQRVWAWASLEVINNWSQVNTWIWEFLYRCDEKRQNWTFCKYTWNRNTVRPRCEVLRKTSLDPRMQSCLLDISSWM